MRINKLTRETDGFFCLHLIIRMYLTESVNVYKDTVAPKLKNTFEIGFQKIELIL